MFTVLQPATRAEDQPYKLVDGWGPLPAGVTWGEVPAMTIDKDGRVLAFHRNEPNQVGAGVVRLCQPTSIDKDF